MKTRSKRLLSMILCLCMVISLLPTFALAVDTPTSTKAGVGELSAPSGAISNSGTPTGNATIVYYGGKPWYVLDLAYSDGAESATNGVLLLSQYAFSYGTQWQAYYTNSDRSGSDQTKGYLASDIRGYLNGSNAAAKDGGPVAGTFTSFRPTQYYGETTTNSNYTRYWVRSTVTETTPVEGTVYFVKDTTPAYISSGVTFANEAEFTAAKSGNELYTRSGSSSSYTYTLVESWTDNTTYYYETTPYVKADVSTGFTDGMTYYTFSKGDGFLKVGNADASTNVAKAYYYAGYSVTGLSSKDATTGNSSREIVAGNVTGTKTFASDMGLTSADLAAILATSRAGLGTGNKYSTTTNANTQYEYYGGALDKDTFFLLNAEDAEKEAYGLNTPASRVAKYWGAAGTSAHWWLSSSGNTNGAGYVDTSGTIGSNGAGGGAIGVRPAFNLNPASVLFTSAAVGGKSELGAEGAAAIFSNLAPAGTNAYKLTLNDIAITAPTCALLKLNSDGTTYTVQWTDGTTAANGYVSAIIKDSEGNIYGYTKLGTGATGTATFTLPEGITLGDTYKLYLFNEKCSTEATGTDYASTLTECSVSTISSIAVAAAEATSTTYVAASELFNKNDITVTATYSNNATMVLTADEYDVTMPNTYNAETGFQLTDGKTAQQELTITAKEGSNITGTIQVTVNGIHQNAPELGIEAGSEGTWNVTGADTTMEFNTTAANATEGWTTVTENGANLTGLGTNGAASTYYVRYAATGNYAAGDVATITIPEKGATGNVASITYTLDGETAAIADRTITLKGQDTAPTYYNYDGTSAVVVAGIYDVWVNNGNGTAPVDSGIDVTIAAEGTNAAVVPFVTVTFDYNVAQEQSTTAPVISGIAYDAATENATATTFAGNNGLTFTAWDKTIDVTTAATVVAQYTVNSATDGAALSVTELTAGNAIPTPADAKLTYGGREYTGTWQVAIDSGAAAAISGNAEFGKNYTYSVTFTPATGYTFTDISSALGSGWSFADSKLTKTFAAITAGYPINITGLPEGVTGITYTLDSTTDANDSAGSAAVTSGAAVISAKANGTYTLTIKTDTDVTYVGTVTVANGSVTATCVLADTDADNELVQAPVAITMMPNYDNAETVSMNTKEIVLSFDQDVNLVGTTATLYEYSSLANCDIDFYTAVYTIDLTSSMLSGRTMTLPISAFESDNLALTLTSGRFYKLVLDAGTVQSATNNLDSLGFADKFSPADSADFTLYLLKPNHGDLYAVRNSGGKTTTSTASATVTANTTDTIMVYTYPDVGYAVDAWNFTVNTVELTLDEAVQAGYVTKDADNANILYITPTLSQIMRIEVSYKVDDGITEYTLTPDTDSYKVTVGGSVALSYRVTPQAASISFVSSDSSVARASGSTIYGVKTGDATITAYAPNGTQLATWSIEVVDPQTARPQITTAAAAEITATSAKLGGSYTGTGFDVREVGIYIRMANGGEWNYIRYEDDNGKPVIPTNREFTMTVDGLTPGATYYYSVYVTTANGSNYVDSVCGDVDTAMSFTTDTSAASVAPSGAISGNTTVVLSETTANNTVTLTVALTTGNDSNTYQWKVLNGSAWDDVSGETSASLTLSNLTMADNGKTYACVVTNKETGKSITTATIGTAVLSISKGAAPAAPGAVGGCTAITNVDTTMEYAATPDFANANDCSGTSVTVAAGTYFVRVKATDYTNAGLAATVTVGHVAKTTTYTYADNDQHNKVDGCQNCTDNDSTVLESCTYGAWVVTVTPTYSSAGEQSRTCVFCGHVDTQVIDKLVAPPSGGSTTYYSLSFETNGGNAIPAVTQVSGSTVSLSGYVPVKTGYIFDGWYSDAGLENLVTSVRLTGNMVVYAKWSKTATVNPFVDVYESDYYYDAVLWAVENNVTQGTGINTFSPLMDCTRAQAVTFLWRAAGSPEPRTTVNPFADVSASEYYYEAVLWAVENGITNGTGVDTFSPDLTVDRAQVVTFLYRLAGCPAVTGDSGFVDAADDAYYAKAVKWAVDEGITLGTGANTFSPELECNRSQIVTFLYRYFVD